MNTFDLEISSPDGSLFHDQVNMLAVRGADGDLAILAGHIPFITSVKPCDFHIELKDSTLKHGRVEGGLLTVSGEKAVFLTGTVKWSD